jgi:hypothetical protein
LKILIIRNIDMMALLHRSTNLRLKHFVDIRERRERTEHRILGFQLGGA